MVNEYEKDGFIPDFMFLRIREAMVQLLIFQTRSVDPRAQKDDEPEQHRYGQSRKSEMVSSP